ncbi:Stp1/IreP family PP2C-type Ser/Thr phosphatase [Salsuginibacillus halophilus]|uniref:Stp1/IreP family PP2C-type Ser/Thr phosphatase n=1 Tax=Salsuginibacillus halophilus TaxID=517424 RepID=UPI000D0D289B|nr:Stp1/IreP family PP2C-type Ser/Thr phosphatase [Salsuginibacillus halophilus]
MKTAFLTDKGQKRPHNEDQGFCREEEDKALAVVCDGMGGHNAGDVASLMAAETVEAAWNDPGEVDPVQHAATWLTEVIAAANHRIYEKANEVSAYRGMGTTLISAVADQEKVVIGHVGDSRAYHYHQEGLTQVSRDQSLVNELVDQGEISEAEAEVHPRKNVLTQALGTETTVTPEVVEAAWAPGDLVLLCSDGLTDKVADESIHDMLTRHPLSEAARTLIDAANEAGGDDNITVALIQYPAVETAER